MIDASDIAHTVELAVAPVFLLAGIGAFLNAATHRLGRVVDRARYLERELIKDADPQMTAYHIKDLNVLDQRMVSAQRAIALCTVAGLMVCLLVALLFVANLAGLNAAGYIAVLFIAAMTFLTGGLSFFLHEVTIATRMLRVRKEIITSKTKSADEA